MHARADAEIDQVIGAADRVFVVLHHDHGVADIAQMPQSFWQPGVIALVQPNGRFVQNVKDARQPRSNLRCQPNSLAFSARQGS